jgi:hypothetical protein
MACSRPGNRETLPAVRRFATALRSVTRGGRIRPSHAPNALRASKREGQRMFRTKPAEIFADSQDRAAQEILPYSRSSPAQTIRSFSVLNNEKLLDAFRIVIWGGSRYSSKTLSRRDSTLGLQHQPATATAERRCLLSFGPIFKAGGICWGRAPGDDLLNYPTRFGLVA